MKFSDYMALKEDSFEKAPAEPKGFGDKPIPEGKVPTTNNGDWGSENAKNDLKEACEYIMYVAESVGFGIDKISRPEGYGLDIAVNALNQFAGSPDAKSFSKPDIDDSMDFDVDDDEFDDIDESAVVDFRSVVEAADYILGLLEEADEDDDLTVNKNGIDTNTIVPHNSEDEQFSKTIDLDDNMFDNSSDWGWDD